MNDAEYQQAIDDIIDAAEAAKILKVHPVTLRLKAAAGIFPVARSETGGGFETAREPIIVCNPELELERDEVRGQEGCLSMPGAYENVWRSKDAFLKYHTPFGEEKALLLSGLEARIAQHEYGHLEGIEFCDPKRMTLDERRAVEAHGRSSGRSLSRMARESEVLPI